MTLAPKQIEDALTDMEWGRYKCLMTLKASGHKPPQQIQIDMIESLAECRVENKRLKETVSAAEHLLTLITIGEADISIKNIKHIITLLAKPEGGSRG